MTTTLWQSVLQTTLFTLWVRYTSPWDSISAFSNQGRMWTATTQYSASWLNAATIHCPQWNNTLSTAYPSSATGIHSPPTRCAITWHMARKCRLVEVIEGCRERKVWTPGAGACHIHCQHWLCNLTSARHASLRQRYYQLMPQPLIATAIPVPLISADEPCMCSKTALRSIRCVATMKRKVPLQICVTLWSRSLGRWRHCRSTSSKLLGKPSRLACIWHRCSKWILGTLLLRYQTRAGNIYNVVQSNPLITMSISHQILIAITSYCYKCAM